MIEEADEEKCFAFKLKFYVGQSVCVKYWRDDMIPRMQF
jgi:hypothetical protein